MKTDKTKLLKDIEAMKKKLTSMEEELNKLEEFKHFPREGDRYYYYTPMGYISSTIAVDNDLKLNVIKTKKEADKAYNKAVALEKVKRRILELQGDWKPNWYKDDEKKFYIQYAYNKRRFIAYCWYAIKHESSIPFMENEQIVELIINEMEDELKLIFDIAHFKN